MKPLLILLTAISSLSANTVYQYEFTLLRDGKPPGSRTAHLDLLTPFGTEVPIEEALYDFEYFDAGGRSFDWFGNPLPKVQPATYTKASGRIVMSGSLSWDHEGLLYTPWSITIYPFGSDTDHTMYRDNLQSYFPGYAFAESTIGYGSWKFSGTRNVPETGTFVMLGLAILTLAVVRRYGNL